MRATARVWCVMTAAVVASLALLTGTADLAYGQGQPAPHVVVVDPVTPDGLARGYTIGSTHDGLCTNGAAGRSWVAHGLLICSFKRETYIDPCWVERITRDGTVHSVVCPLRPWSTSLIRINLARKVSYDPPHAAGPPMRPRHPWGIKLASGLQCNGTFHGTTSAYHGRFTRYPCPGTRRVALYPFVRHPSRWATKTVRLSNRPRHPFVEPRAESIAVVYVARAGEPEIVTDQLPFTGPGSWPISLLTLAALLSISIGAALQKTRG